MSKNILLFLGGFLGEEVLKKLSETKSRPFIAVYPKGGYRRREEFDYSKYSDIFQIFTVACDKFSMLPSDFPLSHWDHLLTVDWAKDFFQDEDKVLSFPVYHAHPSLLPLYRGYGAVSYQFLSGVCLSGISVYEENGKVDGGDILFSEKIRISLEDTPATFLKNCAKAIVSFIERLDKGEIFLKIPQNPMKSFYISRTRNNQKCIDFNSSAYSVHNFIRAYSFPFPYAKFYYKNERYSAVSASIESWSGNDGEPGMILKIGADGMEVACGEGCVLIKEISLGDIKSSPETFGFEEGEFLE